MVENFFTNSNQSFQKLWRITIKNYNNYGNKICLNFDSRECLDQYHEKNSLIFFIYLIKKDKINDKRNKKKRRSKYHPRDLK